MDFLCCLTSISFIFKAFISFLLLPLDSFRFSLVPAPPFLNGSTVDCVVLISTVQHSDSFRLKYILFHYNL